VILVNKISNNWPINYNTYGPQKPTEMSTLIVSSACLVSVGRTDPCRTIKCSYGQRCVLDKLGEARCECSVENECTEDVNEQVCGNDLRDYPSVCHVKKASCSLRRNIIVKYKGPCGKHWIKILIIIRIIKIEIRSIK